MCIARADSVRVCADNRQTAIGPDRQQCRNHFDERKTRLICHRIELEGLVRLRRPRDGVIGLCSPALSGTAGAFRMKSAQTVLRPERR